MVELAQDNVRCLRQGIELLRQLNSDDYSGKQQQCFGSTIGGHIRHNIDHYFSFIKGYEEGNVDYDARVRDNRVETEIEVANAQMAEICDALEAMTQSDLDRELDVIMDCGGVVEPPARSTVRRELQFLLSHTIHHYALIAVICRLRGVEPEADFGVAPSTLRYRGSSSCAQ